jgi:hypothetical protein
LINFIFFNFKELNATQSPQNRSLLLQEDTKKAREQYQREIRGRDGVPLYFTKENITAGFGPHETKKVELFEQLHYSMDKTQAFFRLN